MLIADFRAEYARYRELAEKALAQLPDAELNRVLASEGNSAAMIVRHMSGNFVSRFTNFLTEDGEKPNRDRDREFDERPYSRAEVNELWARGFAVLDAALAPLGDADLERTVTIRQQPMTVHAALARSLAHLAYHVGQIVLLARIHAAEPVALAQHPEGDRTATTPPRTGDEAELSSRPGSNDGTRILNGDRSGKGRIYRSPGRDARTRRTLPLHPRPQVLFLAAAR